MKGENPCVKWHQAARRDVTVYSLYTYMFPGVFPIIIPVLKVILANCGNSRINKHRDEQKEVMSLPPTD